MRGSFFSLAAFLLFFASPVYAGPDANQILKKCQQAIRQYDDQPSNLSIGDSLDAGWCFGWVGSVIEMNYLHRDFADKAHPASADMFYFCAPSGGLTAIQAVRVIVKYLKEHPADLHHNGMALTDLALKSAFPCKAEKAVQEAP